MSMIFIVLPVALVIACCAMAAFVWAVRQGQFDDLDTPPWRALHDDSPPQARNAQDRSGT